jgi:C-terminal processing protease CtpA/Prc
MSSKVFSVWVAAFGLSLSQLAFTPVANAQSVLPRGLMHFFTSAPAPSATPTVYDTLANRRSTLVLPSYTNDQKQRIADQALYFIQNFYVHQTLKKQTFGVDAVAELKAVQQIAQTLSETELHSKIQSIFSRLRDLHTNYNFPKPFQCYSSILPFTLDEAVDASGTDVMAITGLAHGPEFVALAPQVPKLSFGDVLVAFDGMDPNAVLENFDEVGAGANPYALKRQAMLSLTTRSQLNSFLPTHNSEHLKFRRPNGSTYQVDLPWISIADNDCLHPQAPSASPAQKEGTPKKLDPKRFLQAVNPLQVKFNEIFKASKTENVITEMVDTAEPSIHYQVLKTPQGLFGMLRLDSFTPMNEVTATEIISGLLQNELASTQGLIIDLRGNGGGYLSYGEKMLQLFTPKPIQTTRFSMLATEANLDFLKVTQIAPDYVDPMTKALSTHEEFTSPIALTSIADANSTGQAYTKPVIVLVDSSCYSTCDMFTAGMQDNGIAKVISTDVSTGGGGANVMVYSEFAKVYEDTKDKSAPNPFLDLPGGQDMRVAWRQASRVGLNAGKLLENTGVIADQTIKTTVADLVMRDSVILANLTNQLATEYQQSSKSSIVLDTTKRIDFVDGQAFKIPMKVGGTSSVVLSANGVQFAGGILNAESKNLVVRTLNIPAEQLTGLPDLATIEIDGELNLPNGGTEIVWRKLLPVRRIPSVRITSTLQMDFTGGVTAPLKLYQDGPAGWTIVNNALRVGPGPNYPNQDHVEASLFVTLPADQKLALAYTSEVHSEAGFDFFKVSIYVDGQETPLVAPASGDVSKALTTLDLSSYAGKTAEIRFTFTSDQLLNGIGPLLYSLSLQPAAIPLAQKK